MNLETLQLVRWFIQFSIRLVGQFWIYLWIVQTCKAYTKSKLALAVKAATSPSVLGRSLSCCSQTCDLNGHFQDSTIHIRLGTPLPVVMCDSRFNSWSPSGRLKTLGSDLRRLSLQNVDSANHTITTNHCPLGSQHMPVRTLVDHNTQSASHGHDKELAKHDNTGSSLIVGEEQNKWDKSKMEISNGITQYNASQRSPSPKKRRRPARLEIPPSTTSLRNVELKEDMAKEIYVEGSNYAVACKKGRREIMEDAYTVMTDVSGDTSQVRKAFFGVFDGHGGRKAAEYAAENLGRNIADTITELREDQMEDAVRSGYLTTDEAFAKQNLSDGTCCVTAMMKGGHMVVANAGDCRAVLSVHGNAEALTSDHKIEREDERQRIEDLGGYVDCHNGVWRVQGMLAVSRSIGDRHMKEWISAEPEIKALKITSDFEFLILASDGLWDKVGNQEAVDLARACSVEKWASSDVMGACRKLVEVAVRRGSKDDVTVMIVDLRHFWQ